MTKSGSKNPFGVLLDIQVRKIIEVQQIVTETSLKKV